MTVVELLHVVIDMLNHVSVQGKPNVVNLGNAIANLENIANILSDPKDSKSEGSDEE